VGDYWGGGLTAVEEWAADAVDVDEDADIPDDAPPFRRAA
jgi:hypothetical protein